MGNTTSYQLQVVGGNPTISRSLLQLGDDGALWAVGNAVTPSISAVNITQGDSGTLSLSSNSSLSMSLRGPSGKQEYKLGVETPPQQPSMAIGSTVLFDGWQFVDANGRTLLRQQQDAITSRWVAVPQPGYGQTSWALWWYSPNSADMQDFSSYVAVDLEVILAGN